MRYAFVRIEIQMMIAEDVAWALVLILRQLGAGEGELRLVIAIELDASECELVPVLRRLTILEDFVCLVRFSFTYMIKE